MDPTKISKLQKFLKMIQQEAAGIENAPGIIGKLEHMGERGVAAGRKAYGAVRDSPGAATLGAGAGAGGMAAYNALDGDDDDELIQRLLASKGY